MLKYIQTLVCVAVLAAVAVSCKSGDTDVRDAARENLENQAVQPVTTPQDPNVQAPAVPAGPTTTMTFAETTFDFGTVAEGEMVSHTYKFTNTGTETLVLSDAKGSCGCTVPKWPREPIAPGKSADITVEFNSKNKAGKRNQKVTITANTNPPQSFIYLTGEVTGDAAAQTPAITQ
ncbi:MAG: DUF1573 domain-containing protein [Bacteroidetes bacterium]|nr:MAG: DUF1573 domain-containing protein [Bacteroidota bacterium]PTM13568.1 MAG: DUF1573 domain-containing protein [Bacteroidota bacterium]